MADPPDSFFRPPPEVTRYFESKGVRPTFHWQDVNFDEHAMAFTVAKSAGFDILDDVKAAVAKAIAEKQDFETFEAGLKPLLQAKGWWGETVDPKTGEAVEVKTRLVDPATGETVDAQLGSTRRLRTIYWANVRTAFAAGQWERQWRTRRVLPFLLYLISTAEHKRELHLEWVGTILPIEHPWWDTHYPPNGWGCQCRVRQISDAEARRRGYDPSAEPPDDGFTLFTNRRTGVASRVPNGIDPGWAQNPGKTRTSAAADFLAGRLDALSPEARRVAVDDIVGDPLFKRIAEGRVNYDKADKEDQGNRARGAIAMPVAVIPEPLQAAIGAETSVVRLSVADGQKQAGKGRGKKGALGLDAPDYAIVQILADRAEAVLQGPRDVALQGSVDGNLWIAVLRRAATALTALYLKSLHRIQPDQLDVTRTRGVVVRPAVPDPDDDDDGED